MTANSPQRIDTPGELADLAVFMVVALLIHAVLEAHRDAHRGTGVQDQTEHRRFWRHLIERSSDDDTDDEETDAENATDDNTTDDEAGQLGWTASWQDAIGDTVMTAKRDGTAYLQVANQHNRSVNLTFRCVAETDICQYVTVTDDPVTVTASGTETVPVTWTFPDNTSTAPPADPTFDIQITDAASNETATVTVTVVDSLFGPVLPDNFSAPGAARPYLPLLFVPFLGAFAVFVTMRLAQRGKPFSGWDVVIPAAVFMILAVPLGLFILLRVIHA